MAEELGKTEKKGLPDDTVYRQIAPAGVASEVTADNPVAAQTVAALGRFLTEKLGADPALRERVAALSGLSLTDLASLMAGHPLFPLNTDHLQRIATALTETQVIGQTDEVWTALGSNAEASDYILPPTQVVQAMSDN